MAGSWARQRKSSRVKNVFLLVILRRIYVGFSLVTALLYFNLLCQTFNRMLYVKLNEPNNLKSYFAQAPPPGPGAPDASAAPAAAPAASPLTIRAPRNLLARGVYASKRLVAALNDVPVPVPVPVPNPNAAAASVSTAPAPAPAPAPFSFFLLLLLLLVETLVQRAQ